MKILLVGNYLPDQQESMQRFVEVLERELSSANHEIRVVRPPAVFGRLPWPQKIQKWAGYIDKFLLFPLILRQAAARAEVVHICDHSNAMYMNVIGSSRHLITCHDLLAVRSAKGEFSHNKVGFTGKLLQSWIAKGLRAAKTIVCDSKATLDDCIGVLNINPNRLHVVYLGLNYPYYQMAQHEANERIGKLGISSKRRFLMHIGNNSWYKNRAGVLQIFSLLVNRFHRDIDLVIAGKFLTPELHKIAKDAGFGDRVKDLGSISNEDLCALYSRAAGLLFPSLEEGFGWPVLEAQAAGCPVFVSDRAPMTEIGADAAVYIDPLSSESAAVVIEEHLDSPQEMRQRGLENARKFSIANMRDAYLEIYRNLARPER